MKRRGFTLVEAMVGTLIGSIVIGTAVGLLLRAARTMAASDERQDPRERAHMALTILRTSLMDAWQYEIKDEGTRLVFHGPRMEAEVRWNRATSELMYRAPGESRATALIGGGVGAFHVASVRNGFVRFSLALKRGAVRGRAGTPMAVREEVLIPAICYRDDTIPWSPVMEHKRAASNASLFN